MKFEELLAQVKSGQVDASSIIVIVDSDDVAFYEDAACEREIEIDEGEDPRELLHAALFALGFTNTEDA